MLARWPVTYLTWEVYSTGDRPRAISIFAGASALIAADPPGEPVAWSREAIEPLSALRVGTVSQRVLQRAGDDTRIDWGYLYLAAPSAGSNQTVGTREAIERRFASEGVLRAEEGRRQADSGSSSNRDLLLAIAFDEFEAGKTAVSRHAMIAYDEALFDQVPGPKALAVLAAGRRQRGHLLARRA